MVRAKGLADRPSLYSSLSSPGLALKTVITGEARCVTSVSQEKSIVLEVKGTKRWYLKRSLNKSEP